MFDICHGEMDSGDKNLKTYLNKDVNYRFFLCHCSKL